MDVTIAALLTQDGITNGAVYALLALALVLVFAVTRVIWVPSGEFVAYGTLTLAGLQLGRASGIAGLLAGMAVVVAAMELVRAAIPEALKAGKPGTKEFRLGLRNALEKANVVATHGVFVMNALEHNGLDNRARVMVRIENDKWILAK